MSDKQNPSLSVSEQLLIQLGISTERLSKAVITLEPSKPLKAVAEYVVTCTSSAHDMSLIQIKNFELVEK